MYSIPYPYWHQSNLPITTPSSVLSSHSLYQLELLLAQQTAPADTAAIIIEPVLGEGGYVPAPPEFLRGLREICDKHGIMLIVDEVQSGFGRAGAWFAIQESGVRPDILVMAKVRGISDGGRACLSVSILRGLVTDSRLAASSAVANSRIR